MDESLFWGGWFSRAEPLAWWGWAGGYGYFVWMYNGEHGSGAMIGSTDVSTWLLG